MFQVNLFSGLYGPVGKLSCLSTGFLCVAISTYFISMPTDKIWCVTGALSELQLDSDKELEITEPVSISDEYNVPGITNVIVVGDLIRDSSGCLVLYPCSDTWSGVYTLKHPITWFRYGLIKFVRRPQLVVDPVE